MFTGKVLKNEEANAAFTEWCAGLARKPLEPLHTVHEARFVVTPMPDQSQDSMPVAPVFACIIVMDMAWLDAKHLRLTMTGNVQAPTEGFAMSMEGTLVLDGAVAWAWGSMEGRLPGGEPFRFRGSAQLEQAVAEAAFGEIAGADWESMSELRPTMEERSSESPFGDVHPSVARWVQEPLQTCTRLSLNGRNLVVNLRVDAEIADAMLEEFSEMIEQDLALDDRLDSRLAEVFLGLAERLVRREHRMVFDVDTGALFNLGFEEVVDARAVTGSRWEDPHRISLTIHSRTIEAGVLEDWDARPEDLEFPDMSALVETFLQMMQSPRNGLGDPEDDVSF